VAAATPWLVPDARVSSTSSVISSESETTKPRFVLPTDRVNAKPLPKEGSKQYDLVSTTSSTVTTNSTSKRDTTICFQKACLSPVAKDVSRYEGSLETTEKDNLIPVEEIVYVKNVNDIHKASFEFLKRQPQYKCASGYEGIALYPNVAKNNTLAAPKDGVQFVIPPPMPIAGKEIVPHPRKYKTELCRQWEASGKCSHGGKCTFVHDKNKRYHK